MMNAEPAPDSHLEMDYEDRNGCAVTDDETVSPEAPEGCPECGEADCDGTCADDERFYPGEEMDGDAASALASAGFGTDEDYEHDTPLGDEYGGE